MNFKCKVSISCDHPCTQTFSTMPQIINHFKIFHEMKEGTHEFPCVMNNCCSKQFLTFSGLRAHAKKCISSGYVLNF